MALEMTGAGNPELSSSPAMAGDADGIALSLAQQAYLAVRRPVELLVALGLLLLTLPLIVVLAAVVSAETPGGAFFAHRRVGHRGRPFTLYKLRSMVQEAPPYSDKVAISDARITRSGRLLRLSGLDELPQLLNVIKGDMSLIGPRPELPFIVDGYQPWQRQRQMIRPGITGWWQIHHRNHVPMHLGIDHDLHYLRHLGPAIDLVIIVRTVGTIIRGAFTSAGPRGAATSTTPEA